MLSPMASEDTRTTAFTKSDLDNKYSATGAKPQDTLLGIENVSSRKIKMRRNISASLRICKLILGDNRCATKSNPAAAKASTGGTAGIRNLSSNPAGTTKARNAVEKSKPARTAHLLLMSSRRGTTSCATKPITARAARPIPKTCNECQL